VYNPLYNRTQPTALNLYGNYNNAGGMSYNPFNMYGNTESSRFNKKNTGDVSMVFKYLQNRQPYQYNAPSIASMFPLMNMPTMGNLQSPQYTGGAGQFLGGNFLGGLLGNASAAPAAATDASSGAGRYA